jgi:N-terminal region of Chorein or VPS13
MVFEGLVVDLVNRFLGDYITNLDQSQLSLGLWGGEHHVVLYQFTVRSDEEENPVD